jgi:adenylate cyclase
MATETERKFLVNRGWTDVVPKEIVEITQGYLPTRKGVTVRVRVVDRNGVLGSTMTVKGPTRGISRPEFEYEISVDDGIEMLHTLCGRHIVRKIRLTTPSSYKGLVWEIDVFKGRHEGLVLAEIELDHPNRKISRLPTWVGLEVSDQPRFSNHSLAIHGLKLVGKMA